MCISAKARDKALVTQQLLVIAEIWPDVRCAFAAKLGNNMPDRDYCFGAVRSASASGPRFLYTGCPQETSMAMLVEQFTLLGLTPQNWMIVTLAMIVIAALISRMENG